MKSKFFALSLALIITGCGTTDTLEENSFVDTDFLIGKWLAVDYKLFGNDDPESELNVIKMSEDSGVVLYIGVNDLELLPCYDRRVEFPTLQVQRDGYMFTDIYDNGDGIQEYSMWVKRIDDTHISLHAVEIAQVTRDTSIVCDIMLSKLETEWPEFWPDSACTY